MAMNIDLSLFAGDAYISNRSDNNQFPVPYDWKEMLHTTKSSGFEAVSFQRGDEIVISFAGTNTKSIGDLVADFNLAMGWGSKQLLQAAEYYLQVKKGANPNTVITFTGHSLGGGLAALMGVFFNKKAVTFDQAPFAASAKLSIRNDIEDYLTKKLTYTYIDLATLAPELLSCTDSDLSLRQSNISGQYVQGELLTADWPFNRFDFIGNQVPIDHGPTSLSGGDLHAQSLLTVFLANNNLLLITEKLTDLLNMLFDTKLYATETYKNKENFLERLIRHEYGNAPGVTQADQMLTRFTNDLQVIAQDGGLTMSDSKLSDALTAFAMQMYYDSPKATDEKTHLFDGEGVASGALHFDRSDVAESLDKAKGYNLYFKKYLRSLSGNDTGVVTQQLPDLLDWYVQAGSAAMVATASTQKAFMLGGNKGDTLTGGADADLLYGGKETDTLIGSVGADTLIGGIGDDVLNGGLGHDVYDYTIGDGNDQIIDEDGDGELVLFNNGREKKRLALSNFYENGQNEWVSIDGSKIKITCHSPYKIVLPDGGTIDLGVNFQTGNFDINLIDVPDVPVITNTLIGSDDGNYLAPIEDTANNDSIAGMAGDDWIGNGSGHGGNDWLQGNDGNDLVQGGGGNDIVEGNAGSDYVTGGAGDDKLFGDDYGEMDQLIANGEIANGINERGDLIKGEDGNDYIYGSDRKDLLFGGSGHDLLVGGGGDDAIYGDDSFTLAGTGGATPAFWNDWSFVNLPNGGGVSMSKIGYVQNTYGESDVIYAGTGNDYVFAGGGDDEVYAGDGNDTASGEGGDDFIEGGVGDDRLEGDASWVAAAEQGEDYIDGGAGEDILIGSGGSDELFGGDGNDTLYGDASYIAAAYHGDDYLDGEAGDDSLVGSGGADTLFGGDGNDILYGDASDVDVAYQGDDYLDGEAGDDTLIGAGGSDELYGGEGNDTLYGDALDVAALSHGDDYLDGEDGNDLLFGFGGSDTLDGGNGNDTLYGDESHVDATYQGDDYLDGGAGDDSLTGMAGSDTLYGGEGNDTLIGDTYADTASDGSDYLDGEDGDDCLIGSGGSDTLIGGQGNDMLYGDTSYTFPEYHGDDYLDGGDGNDQLTGYAGNDTLYGGSGDDTLYGDEGEIPYIFDGDDYLSGDAGNDVLVGYGGDDTLAGGEGDDTLDGGVGDDTYNYGLGDGSDTIVYAGYTATSFDKIEFGPGIVFDDLEMTRMDSDLNIKIKSTEESLLIKGQLYGSSATIDEFDFDDGSVITAAQIADSVENSSETLTGGAGPDVIQGYGGDDDISGGAGDDTLYGDDGNDILDGGPGNDELYGGNGDDTYIFNRGSGVDTIINAHSGGIDTLQFGPGITLDDLEVVIIGLDMQINIIGTADSLLLPEWRIYCGSMQYAFDGGTVIDLGRLLQKVKTEYGTNNTDDLYACYANDTALYGLGADDQLNGAAGNDTLDGGTGNDILRGDAGNDTYIFNRGYGFDLIDERSAGGVDTILFGSDINPSDIKLRHYGHNLELSLINTEDKLTILDWYTDDSSKIERIQFADGTVWDVPTIEAQVPPSETGGDENIIGTAENDWLIALNGNDLMEGLSGDDVLFGDAGNDTLDGGEGYNRLYGGTGNDTYVVASGMDIVIEYPDEGVDTVQSSIDYTLGPNIENLTLSDHGANNSTMHTTAAPAAMIIINPGGGAKPTIGTGNELNNVVIGNSANNVLTGLGGDDHLDGGTGADSLVGGTGDDTYVFHLGDGVDTIQDQSSLAEGNRILFGEGITPADLTFVRNGSVLTINYGNMDDAINLLNFDQDEISGSFVVRILQFADGTQVNLARYFNRPPVVANAIPDQTTMEDAAFSFTVPADTFTDPDKGDTLTYSATLSDGTALPSWLSFNAATMTFSGTPGNDNGGAISLKIIATDSSGASTATEFNLTVVNTNDPPVVVNAISDQTTMEDAAFSFMVPANTFADVDVGDTLTYSATLADGTSLPSWLIFNPVTMTFSGTPVDAGKLSVKVIAMDSTGASASDVYDLTVQATHKTTYGTNGMNSITTGSDNDLIYALGGPDFVYSGAGNDTLYGGDGIDLLCGDGGDDIIYGENDSDMLDGGNGNDFLSGGSGNDFLYGGSGDDTLDGGTGVDVLAGGAGDDVYIVDSTGDIVIALYNEGTDTVQSSITYTLKSNVENLTLTGASAINGIGNTLDNVLRGNTGNNTLNGGAGNDTYVFSLGGGTDVVTDSGADSSTQDLLKFQSDVLTESIAIFQGTSDLSIAYGASDMITVTNQTSTSYGIEKVQLDNGLYMTATDINQLIQNMAAFATSHGLAFSSVNDVKASSDLMGMVSSSWHS